MSGRTYLAGQAVEMHQHDFYQMHYVKSGEETLELNGQRYTLKPESFAFLPSNQPHGYSFEKTTQIIDFKFNLSTNFCHLIRGLQNHPVVKTKKLTIIRNIINSLDSAEKASGSANETDLLIVDTQLKLILLELSQIVAQEAAPESSLLDPELLKSLPRNLADMVKYIEDNYYEPIELLTLTNRFSYSKSQIIKLFKNHLQTTPIKFIQLVRINHSKQLLENGDQTIEMIANQVGLSTNYYIKLFANFEDMSPLTYRRKRQQQKKDNIILSDSFDITTQPKN